MHEQVHKSFDSPYQCLSASRLLLIALCLPLVFREDKDSLCGWKITLLRPQQGDFS